MYCPAKTRSGPHLYIREISLFDLDENKAFVWQKPNTRHLIYLMLTATLSDAFP